MWAWLRPPVNKTINPPPIGPRPSPPASQAAPILELTKKMVLKPSPAQWLRANKMFEHPRGCRCSTCRLVAEMAVMIQDYDARRYIGGDASGARPATGVAANLKGA
jgi:hypothetical protein